MTLEQELKILGTIFTHPEQSELESHDAFLKAGIYAMTRKERKSDLTALELTEAALRIALDLPARG